MESFERGHHGQKALFPEQIIGHLRQAEILIAEGKTIGEAGRRPGSGHLDPEGNLPGKLLSPTRRRQAVGHVCQVLTVSERRACRVPGQVRRTQRYTPRVADDEAALTANIVSLASEYGRYGYCRITALLTLASEPQASRADLAMGGAEGARQTSKARLAVAHK